MSEDQIRALIAEAISHAHDSILHALRGQLDAYSRDMRSHLSEMHEQRCEIVKLSSLIAELRTETAAANKAPGGDPAAVTRVNN